MNKLKIKELESILSEYQEIPDEKIEQIIQSSKLNHYLKEIFNDINEDDIIDINDINELEISDKIKKILLTYLDLNNITYVNYEEIHEEGIVDQTIDTIVNHMSEDILSDYYNSIKTIPILTKEQEIELFKAYEKNHDLKIRDKIMYHNLKLSFSIASHYFPYEPENAMDLIQEGNLGILKAISKFNLSKGVKFSTYAVPWIKQHISRYRANNNRNIRIPCHVHENISKINRFIKKYKTKYGKDPSEEEISKKTKLNIEKIRECLKVDIQTSTASLDSKVSEDDDNSTLIDFISDDEKYNVEEEVLDKIAGEELREVLKNLTEREEKVIRLRFGLDDGKVRRLKEIGDLYNVSREMIRQNEARALKKLRMPNNTKKLET